MQVSINLGHSEQSEESTQRRCWLEKAGWIFRKFTQDDFFKKISYIVIFIILFGNNVQAQTITGLEYFFDADPGVGAAASISSFTNGDEITFTGDLSASTLSRGIHTLYIRAKNSDEEWGVPSKKLVLVDAGLVVEIETLEYFFDTDPGVGEATQIPITQGSEIELETQISTTGVGLGIHTLYIRAKIAGGGWGLPSKQLVLIDKDDPNTISQIVSAEYFFDADPGFGNAHYLELNDASELDENVTLNVDSMSSGVHTLYIRVLDEDGEWSLIVNREITITVGPGLESIESSALTFTENDLGTSVTDSLVVKTDGSFFIDSAVVDMSATFEVGEDSLSIADSDSVVITAQEGVFYLRGTASASYYQTLLRSVAYINLSENPTETTRTVAFRVFGNEDSSNIAMRDIHIIAVDDAPTRVLPIADLELPEDVEDSLVLDLDDYYTDPDSPISYSIEDDSEEITITISEDNQVFVSSPENWFGEGILFITASSGDYTIEDTVQVIIYSVNDAPPTKPEVLAPTDNGEIDLNAYFVWSLSEDTVIYEDPSPLYHLQIDTSSAFNSPVVDQTKIGFQSVLKVMTKARFLPTKSKSVADQDSVFAVRLGSLDHTEMLKDNGHYYWRVRSVDSEDSASVWSQPWSFWLNLGNDAPEMVSSGFTPANSTTISSLQPLISWNASSDPDFSDTKDRLSYITQLSMDTTFTTLMKTDTTKHGVNSSKMDSLSDESLYYWRVKALDDEGEESGWSSVQAFITNQRLDPPNPFELLSPENGVDTLTVTPKFRWSATSDPDLYDQVSYSFRIAEDSLFMTLLYEFEGLADSSANLVTNLPVGTYFWQVAAIDTDSLVTWGSLTEKSPYRFTIVQRVFNEMEEGVPTEFTLSQNYPNPFNPSSTIRFGLPETAQVRMEVFNTLGQRVANLVNNQTMQAGWHSVQFNASNLSSGVYIYQIQAGDFVQTKRMMLIK